MQIVKLLIFYCYLGTKLNGRANAERNNEYILLELLSKVSDWFHAYLFNKCVANLSMIVERNAFFWILYLGCL